ncbi:MAG: hypothetical protein R3E32_21810 [Chitinophagales bacterium]
MTTIVERIGELLELKFENTSFFVVELKPTPGNKIQIFVDKDENITSGDCVKIFKYLKKSLEDEGTWHENLYLEVSSPGMSKPFRVLRQYKKNIGRHIIIQMLDGSQKEGILKEILAEEVVIDEYMQVPKKAKPTIQKIIIPFDIIKCVKKKITF